MKVAGYFDIHYQTALGFNINYYVEISVVRADYVFVGFGIDGGVVSVRIEFGPSLMVIITIFIAIVIHVIIHRLTICIDIGLNYSGRGPLYTVELSIPTP